jgi:hypothetical protein
MLPPGDNGSSFIVTPREEAIISTHMPNTLKLVASCPASSPCWSVVGAGISEPSALCKVHQDILP